MYYLYISKKLTKQLYKKYGFSQIIKLEYNNNKFKISASTWNDTFDLPGGSYSISDIQDFEFIIKKHETLIENPPIQIYPNKIKNRIVFKINTDCK